MTLYVAIVAILNLALGYALAVMLRKTPQTVLVGSDLEYADSHDSIE